MRWPIRNQILVPYAATLVVAVTTTALATAYLDARRSRAESLRGIRNVVETLGQSTFPYTKSVVEKMRGLSGSHFLAIDPHDRILATTLTHPVDPAAIRSRTPELATIETLTDYPSVDIGGIRYFVAHIKPARMGAASSLYVLYPEADWLQIQRDAIWAPLLVCGVTILLMSLISMMLSRRLDRRIQAVRGLFAKLADGHFDHAKVGTLDDEIRDLLLSANCLSDQLSTLRDQFSRTERLRLLAQLAGGLAHQLRNAVTGARMAIQLHQRRFPNEGDDESLNVALQQLTLTEEQLRGLLALGKDRVEKIPPAEVAPLLDEVSALIDPVCRHTQIDFQRTDTLEDNSLSVPSGADIKAAILNLLLNGIEAAGVGGSLWLSAHCNDGLLEISVTDNGPGPPDAMQDRILEPFVSSKPEGVGLGLSLAEMAATANGGTLSWRRDENRTVFTFSIPVLAHDDAPSHESAASPRLNTPTPLRQGVSSQ